MFRVLHAQIPASDLVSRSDTFTLMMQIESNIHAEVRKLYPDADLPHFEHTRLDQYTLLLKYRSERGMASFAEGLISGCIEHFGEPIVLERADSGEHADCDAIFMLRRVT